MKTKNPANRSNKPAVRVVTHVLRSYPTVKDSKRKSKEFKRKPAVKSLQEALKDSALKKLRINREETSDWSVQLPSFSTNEVLEELHGRKRAIKLLDEVSWDSVSKKIRSKPEERSDGPCSVQLPTFSTNEVLKELGRRPAVEGLQEMSWDSVSKRFCSIPEATSVSPSSVRPLPYSASEVRKESTRKPAAKSLEKVLRDDALKMFCSKPEETSVSPRSVYHLSYSTSEVRKESTRKLAAESLETVLKGDDALEKQEVTSVSPSSVNPVSYSTSKVRPVSFWKPEVTRFRSWSVNSVSDLTSKVRAESIRKPKVTSARPQSVNPVSNATNVRDYTLKTLGRRAPKQPNGEPLVTINSLYQTDMRCSKVFSGKPGSNISEMRPRKIQNRTSTILKESNNKAAVTSSYRVIVLSDESSCDEESEKTGFEKSATSNKDVWRRSETKVHGPECKRQRVEDWRFGEYNAGFRKMTVSREIHLEKKFAFKKSVEHREKLRSLKAFDKEKLTKIGSPVKCLACNKNFLLGKGSMGTSVYLGILEDGSEVAVKRMLIESCEDAAENERKILNLIDTKKSPFIVNYRHFLKDDIFLYLIVDLCEQTLDQHIRAKSIEYLRVHGPRMVKEVLAGLSFLHSERILHRDLKPSNVLVDVDGHMRLADFGISRVLNEDETTVHTDTKGTEGWMAAEVIENINRKRKGRFKKKSDIQPAGMIAFFILTRGGHPFGKVLYERMNNIVNGNPVNLNNLNDINARQFVSRLISREINDRPTALEAMLLPFLNSID